MKLAEKSISYQGLRRLRYPWRSLTEMRSSRPATAARVPLAVVCELPETCPVPCRHPGGAGSGSGAPATVAGLECVGNRRYPCRRREGETTGPPGRGIVKTIAALIGVAALALAGTASAAVRTASVTVPAPYQLPSLVTPVVDTEPYLHTAAVSYDDGAGIVTGSMSLYDPSYWASQDSTGGGFDNWQLDMTLATACITASGTVMDSSGATDLAFAIGPATDASSTSTSAWTGTTLTGYGRQLTGSGPFDGTNYTAAVQSDALARRDFRCVRFEVTDNDMRSDGANWYDSGWQWIPGYAPLNPWVRLAARQTVRALTRLANIHHTIGFSSRTEYLSPARVTNAASSNSIDKWAWTNIKARDPKYQGNGGILFAHQKGRWKVVGGGSTRVPSEPQAVVNAFFG